MARPAVDLQFAFHVEFIEIPKAEEAQFDAGIFLLLQWLESARSLEVAHEPVDIGCHRDAGGVRASFFPVAHPAQGKRTSPAGGLHAWVIGHDGSVQRMALVDWRA